MVWNLIKYKYAIFVFANTNTYLTPALATNFGSFFQKINLQGRNKLIVLSMSANEFTEVPHTIGCKISQGIVC